MVRFLFLVRPIYKAIFKGEEMKANSENMLLLKATLVPCQGIQFTDSFLGRAGSSSWMKKVHPWGGHVTQHGREKSAGEVTMTSVILTGTVMTVTRHN